MVVLARAAGVPARLAIGYASGTYNLNSKRFIVTEADGHSWVEVYFPDIGWVPFEPTASRPQLEREEAAPAVQPAEPPSPSAPQGRTILPVWRWLLGGAGSVILLGVLWVLFTEIRLHRLPKQAAAVEVYKRLRRYGNALGMRSSASDTPFEFASLLTVHLQRLMPVNVKPAFTAELLQDMQTMTTEIVQNPLPSFIARIFTRYRYLEAMDGLAPEVTGDPNFYVP